MAVYWTFKVGIDRNGSSRGNYSIKTESPRIALANGQLQAPPWQGPWLNRIRSGWRSLILKWRVGNVLLRGQHARDTCNNQPARGERERRCGNGVGRSEGQDCTSIHFNSCPPSSLPSNVPTPFPDLLLPSSRTRWLLRTFCALGHLGYTFLPLVFKLIR